MDGTYDAIVLGTGLKECILSGLLSVHGKKVLHLDRNDYYGAASASLNLAQLFEQFKGGAAAPDSLGQSRDYNIDIIPKFIMANGLLVKILIKTDVHKYLEFKSIDGSYVVKDKKVHKVPAGEKEALTSSLLGLMEKRRFQKFLEFVNQWEPENPSTHKGFNLDQVPMSDVFKKFKLSENTIDFTGHALALYIDDSYLEQPASQTLSRIRLYFESLLRYQKSPYIYPLYGLGDLPQAFARLSSIYGGTYMLNQPIDEILMEGGKFVGVRSGTEVAKAAFVIGDPSYFPDRVAKSGRLVRIACIMDHPISGTVGESTQIIIPQKQVGRSYDIYVTEVSAAHCVAPPGKFVAMVSTTLETDGDPVAECEPGLRLLRPIEEQFVMVSDILKPTDGGESSQIFVTESYDATSHFETTCIDVLNMYKRITGQDLDLEVATPTGEDE